MEAKFSSLGVICLILFMHDVLCILDSNKYYDWLDGVENYKVFPSNSKDEYVPLAVTANVGPCIPDKKYCRSVEELKLMMGDRKTDVQCFDQGCTVTSCNFLDPQPLESFRLSTFEKLVLLYTNVSVDDYRSSGCGAEISDDGVEMKFTNPTDSCSDQHLVAIKLTDIGERQYTVSFTLSG